MPLQNRELSLPNICAAKNTFKKGVAPRREFIEENATYANIDA